MKYLFQHTAWISFTIILFFLLTGCDSNSSDDEVNLSGVYDLISITDKSGDEFELQGQTIPAGELLEIPMTEQGIDFILGIYLEGTLSTTSTTYSITLSITIEIDHANAENEQMTDAGSYSISGNSMTLNSTDPDSDGPETFTFTVEGQNLTLENSDMQLIFKKR